MDDDQFHELVCANYMDVAHAEAIAIENTRRMREVDAFHAPRRGAYGTGRERADKTKRTPNTLHDLAQTNPFVFQLLVDAQKKGWL